MNTTNCPNCAAPLQIGEVKCPYCGTVYYDLSAIDFDSCEPIYLTIKFNNAIITQKALPKIANFEINTETADAIDSRGNKLITFPISHTLQTNITFEAILDKKNTLCEVKYDT